MRPDMTKNLKTILDRKEMNRIPAEILEKIEKRLEELKMMDKQTKTEIEGEYEFSLFVYRNFQQSRTFFYCAAAIVHTMCRTNILSFFFEKNISDLFINNKFNFFSFLKVLTMI